MSYEVYIGGEFIMGTCDKNYAYWTAYNLFERTIAVVKVLQYANSLLIGIVLELR